MPYEEEDDEKEGEGMVMSGGLKDRIAKKKLKRPTGDKAKMTGDVTQGKRN